MPTLENEKIETHVTPEKEELNAKKEPSSKSKEKKGKIKRSEDMSFFNRIHL